MKIIYSCQMMLPSPPAVWIVVLNYNGRPQTIECLGSLKKLDYPNKRVLVVDNKSSDGSAQYLKEWIKNQGGEPLWRLIESPENGGYASGNNQGVRYALENGADYVWILNNDVTVAPESLNHLVQKAESGPQSGLIGAGIYDGDEPHKIQAAAGGYINPWFVLSCHSKNSGPKEQTSNLIFPCRFFYIHGACLFIKAAMLRQIGLLDENFFLYWEDADLSLRAQKAGWKLGWAPQAKVWHKESATHGRRSAFADYHHTRSANLFMRKHYPLWHKAAWLIILSGKILTRIRRAQFNRLGLIWRALRPKAPKSFFPEPG